MSTNTTVLHFHNDCNLIKRRDMIVEGFDNFVPTEQADHWFRTSHSFTRASKPEQYRRCSCLPPQKLISTRRHMVISIKNPEYKHHKKGCREEILDHLYEYTDYTEEYRLNSIWMSRHDCELEYDICGSILSLIKPPTLGSKKDINRWMRIIFDPIYILLTQGRNHNYSLEIEEHSVLLSPKTNKKWSEEELHLLMGILRDVLTVVEREKCPWFIDIPPIPSHKHTSHAAARRYLHNILLPWYRKVFSNSSSQNSLRTHLTDRYNLTFLRKP